MPGMFYKKQLIEPMVAAVEHIRDCERCQRVYIATFESVDEASASPGPFFVLDQCRRELRECPRWPAGI
jgi:hypothetical protein